ncbi:MAG: glutamyl-tRNA reductase, partial [Veillonella sp.]
MRERFSFDKDEVASALNRLMNLTGVSRDALYYPPCNRTEIYAAL